VRPLSSRERDVLLLLAHGYSYHQAAGQLYLSRNTIQAHVRRMLAAKEVHATATLVAVGFRDGELDWRDGQLVDPRAQDQLACPVLAETRPPARAETEAEVIERVHREWPSTAREWDAQMVTDCRRPILQLLADRFERTAAE
jgi:hypothetical protein